MAMRQRPRPPPPLTPPVEMAFALKFTSSSETSKMEAPPSPAPLSGSPNSDAPITVAESNVMRLAQAMTTPLPLFITGRVEWMKSLPSSVASSGMAGRSAAEPVGMPLFETSKRPPSKIRFLEHFSARTPPQCVPAL